MMSKQEQQLPPKGSPRRESVSDCYHYRCCDNIKNNDDSYDEKLIQLAKIRDILNSPAPAVDIATGSTTMNGTKKGSSSTFPKPLAQARKRELQFLLSNSTDQPSLNHRSKQQQNAPVLTGREIAYKRKPGDGSDRSRIVCNSSSQNSGSSRSSSFGSSHLLDSHPSFYEGNGVETLSYVCSSDHDYSPSLESMESIQNWKRPVKREQGEMIESRDSGSRGKPAAMSSSRKTDKSYNNNSGNSNNTKTMDDTGVGKEIMDKYFNDDEDFCNPSFWSKKIKGFQSSPKRLDKAECQDDDGDATAHTAACSTVGTAIATGISFPTSSSSRRTGTQLWKMNGKNGIGKPVAFVSKFHDSVSSLEISSQSILMGYGNDTANGIGFNSNFIESERTGLSLRTNREIIQVEELISTTASTSASASDPIPAGVLASDIIDRKSNFGKPYASTSDNVTAPNEDLFRKTCYSSSSDHDPPPEKINHDQPCTRPKYKPSSIHWGHEEDDDDSHRCNYCFEHVDSRFQQIQDTMDSFLLGSEGEDDSDGNDGTEDDVYKIKDDQEFDRLRDEDDLFAEGCGVPKKQARGDGARNRHNMSVRKQHCKLDQMPVPSTLTTYYRKRSATPKDPTIIHNNENRTNLRRSSEGGPPISSIIVILDSQKNDHQNRRSSSCEKDKINPVMTRTGDKTNSYHHRHSEGQSDQETISKINKLMKDYHKLVEDRKRVCFQGDKKTKKDPHQSSSSRRASVEIVAGKSANPIGKTVRNKDERNIIHEAAISSHVNPTNEGNRERKSAELNTTGTTVVSIQSTHMPIPGDNKALSNLVDSTTSTSAQPAYYIDNSFTREFEAQKPPIPEIILKATGVGGVAATYDAHSTKIYNNDYNKEATPSTNSARLRKDNRDKRRNSSDAPSPETFERCNGRSAKKFGRDHGRSAEKASPSQRKMEYTTVDLRERDDKMSSFRRHSVDCQSSLHIYSPGQDGNKIKSIEYTEHQRRRSSARDECPVTKSEGNILHERETAERRQSRNDEKMNVHLHDQSQSLCSHGLGHVRRRLSADIIMEKRMARQGHLEAVKLNPFAYF